MLVFTTAWPATGNAAPIRFSVQPGGGSVRFTSEATLETVVGRSSHLTGWCTVDPANLAGARAEFSVPLSTLATGNRLRDKDMRTDFLQTDRYPEVRFTLQKLVGGPRALAPSVDTEVTAEGTFELHGVRKAITVPVKVRYEPEGARLQVRASFPILLSDYNIARPQFLFMRLSESVSVTMSAMMEPAEPTGQ